MPAVVVLLEAFWPGRRGDQFDEGCPAGHPRRVAAA